jgi:hypothetical protein
LFLEHCLDIFVQLVGFLGIVGGDVVVHEFGPTGQCKLVGGRRCFSIFQDLEKAVVWFEILLQVRLKLCRAEVNNE